MARLNKLSAMGGAIIALVDVSFAIWTVEPGPAGDWVAALRWACVMLTFVLFLLSCFTAQDGKLIAIAGLGALLLLPSVLWSSDPSTSLIEFSRLYSCIVVGLLLTKRAEYGRVALKHIGAISTAICWVSLALLFAGIHTTGEDWSTADRLRVSGITSHPNIFAFVGAIAFAAAWGGIAEVGFLRVRSILSISNLIVACGCVIASDSRTGLIMILLVPPLLLARKLRVFWRSKLSVWIVFVAVVIASLAPMAMALSNAGAFEDSLQSEGTRQSNGERLVAWATASQIFELNPYLGQGLGREIYVGHAFSSDGVLRYAHNVLLTYMADCGVLGVLIVALTFWTASAAIRRGQKLMDGRSHSRLVPVAVGLVAGTLIFSIVEGGLQGVMMTQFTFVACLAYLSRAPVELS